MSAPSIGSRREKGEMMRRTAILGLCAALIGVGLVGGSLLPAASQETQTFTRCEKNNRGFEKFVNVGKRGLSAGDWSVASSPVFNPATGDRVGRTYLRFTIVKPIGRRDARSLVDGVVQLGRGKVSFYGTFKFSGFPQGVTTPITGGTGSFAGAGGTLTARSGRCDGAAGTRLTFEVVT
jgi:hypothetical protein